MNYIAAYLQYFCDRRRERRSRYNIEQWKGIERRRNSDGRGAGADLPEGDTSDPHTSQALNPAPSQIPPAKSSCPP